MSVISTRRLTLRPFERTDAEAVFSGWASDERAARYCRWYPHEDISVTHELLDMYIGQAEKGFDYRWAIVLSETGELIGCIDVVKMSEDRKTAEIGYVLSPSHWCNGYATEALKTVIRILFRCGFTKITARHHIDNPASGRVMEKCGMHFTGTSTTQEKIGSDKLCEVKCYEITEGSFGR